MLTCSRGRFLVRPSETIGLVEHFQTAPELSMMDPCASAYEGFIVWALGTVICRTTLFIYEFVREAASLLDPMGYGAGQGIQSTS